MFVNEFEKEKLLKESPNPIYNPKYEYVKDKSVS